jgi:hypothetical protein
MVEMDVRRVSGAAPKICIWETGPNRCAPIPTLAASNTWIAYRATLIPDSATTALDIFLYAEVDVPHTLTEDDYSNINVLELPSLPEMALVATPIAPLAPSRLVIHRSTYSDSWQGPAGSKHVLVDGLMNGWLVQVSRPFVPTYKQRGRVQAGLIVSALGFSSVLALGFSGFVPAVARLRRRKHEACASKRILEDVVGQKSAAL